MAELLHWLNDMRSSSAVTSFTLLWEGLLSGSDGWDGFSLLNNADRSCGTATNFVVCSCLIINKYTNVTRETRHVAWEADLR